MRVAFADLLFSWPPHGGADVDLYHVLQGLAAAGHDVHLFVAGNAQSWERGTFDPAAMPFPATLLPFDSKSLRPTPVGDAFRKAIDAYRPDVVVVADGFFLKPAVVLALADAYPVVSRFYAYEAICMRDPLHYRDGAPCDLSYLETPNFCRKCALQGDVIKQQLRQWQFLTWTEEYLNSNAYRPVYYRHAVEALARTKLAIVYNTRMAAQLERHVQRTAIVPGGVNASDYTATALPERGPEDRKVILMTGRTEDPLKGMAVLQEAGERLASTRGDFEIQVTHTDPSLNTPWFKAIGWHKPHELGAFYENADVCVVPSIWEEPFGIVALEAMAKARPVCVSRVGGLQTIVTDGESGYLFARGDAAALADLLARLLDDAALRQTMGNAARNRVETEYDWPNVIAHYYEPLLEEAAS